MRIYLDTYRRSTLPGSEGFCFVGGKWPESETKQKKSLQSLVLDIVKSIFGDHYNGNGETYCQFCLRNLEDYNGVTVIGQASIERDKQGRYGTVANVMVCIPENEIERQSDIDIAELMEKLSEEYKPGIIQECNIQDLPKVKLRRGVIIQDKLFNAFSWKANRVVAFDLTSEQEGRDFCYELYYQIPVVARLRFSFITFVSDWAGFYMKDRFSIICTGNQPGRIEDMRRMERVNRIKLKYFSTVNDDDNLNELTTPCDSYLTRSYMSMLNQRETWLVEKCAEWITTDSDFAVRNLKTEDAVAVAFGLMLVAARNERSEYYPTPEEKQYIQQHIFDLIKK